IVGGTVQDRYAVAFDKACVLQALLESAQMLLDLQYRSEEPDHRHRRLLRARGERPCNGRTSNDFNEVASSHCLPQGLGSTPAMTDYIRDLRRNGVQGSVARSNLEPLMSALGQKRTFTHIRPMSALPPKTEIRSYSIHLVGELLYRKPPGVRSGHP